MYRCVAHPVQYQGQRSTHGEPDSTTTHALQNERFISARMHRKHRHKPAPNDTAVSAWGIKPADGETETQTKPLDKHFAFPERLFCPLQEEEAAAAAPFHQNALPKRVYRTTWWAPTCLSWGRRAHMSRRLFWSVIVVIIIIVGTVMCLPAPCYYHWVEDCAVLCATSGLLRRANERSLWRRRGRRARWICRAPVQQSRDNLQSRRDALYLRYIHTHHYLVRFPGNSNHLCVFAAFQTENHISHI